MKLKNAIQFSALKGFAGSLAITALALAMFCGAMKDTNKEYVSKTYVGGIIYSDVEVETDNNAVKIPEKIVIPIGTRQVAGIFVPAPDPVISTDQIADYESLSNALSRAGDYNGEITPEMIEDDYSDAAEKLRKTEEDEPEEKTFQPFEIEQPPQYELTELQRLVIYPDMAIEIGLEGKVIVKAVIGPEGKVIDAEIFDSSNSMFDEAALNGVKAYVFVPAIMNGSPVKCTVIVPINFRLK